MMEQDQIDSGGRSLSPRLVIGGVALVALVLFVVQNTGKVQVSFLWMEGRFPLYLLLLITVALTVVGAMAATFVLRRRDS